MPELVQTLLLLLGLLGAQFAGSGDTCPGGACPAVPERPVVSWAAPQTLRADEVRLFSRGEYRPGQPGIGIEAPDFDGSDRPREFLLVAPALERLRPALEHRATVQLRLRRLPAPR
ncbi:MAG: hypothetical protein NTY35_05850 [Planctomycetota bacterium]|nr:hypothetical protein [Planctomycetota bacterium]